MEVPAKIVRFNRSKWIDDVRSERGNDVIIMLVGNKGDLRHLRAVGHDEALAFAEFMMMMREEEFSKEVAQN